MRKMFVYGLLALVMCGCSKEEVYVTPEEAEVTLDYTFAESGSLTRTGTDAYTNFYNKYIKNKVLTPSNYTLTFKNVETNAVAKIDGKWKNKDAIRLPEGEYVITGTSHPIETERLGCPSDTVYLCFEERITIKKDMTVLNLNASYDSFLLLFDCENYQDIYYYNVMELAGSTTQEIKKDLNLVDTHYALFIKDLNYGVYNDDGHYIKTTRNDGSVGSITLDNISFEKGKYYYFNDMANSFDIPPMESGN